MNIGKKILIGTLVWCASAYVLKQVYECGKQSAILEMSERDMGFKPKHGIKVRWFIEDTNEE